MSVPEPDRLSASPGPEQVDPPIQRPPDTPPPPVVAPGEDRDPLLHTRGGTRWGSLWQILAVGAVILVLLLVFILQNSENVELHIYGAHWNAPVGVALLMAAALGVLLVVIPGTVRILQLRRSTRKAHRRAVKLNNAAATTTDTAGTTDTTQISRS